MAGKIIGASRLVLLMLRLLLQLWAYSRAILLGSEQPVGVPFIEDAATQANREAESLGAASEYDKESQEQS